MTIRAVIFDLGGVLVRTSDFGPREGLAAMYDMTLGELMDLVFDHEAGRRFSLARSRLNNSGSMCARHWCFQ
jgi:phosphoglycolate phosphatase-like HAD superfamily hydrolase